MGMWDDSRPKVMACVCCLTGLILLIWSSVVFANRLGDEVQLWYNIPLCPTKNQDFAVSRNYQAPATCPPAVTLETGYDATTKTVDKEKNSAEEVTYDVPQKYFNPNAKYTTFAYRSDGSDIYALPADVTLSLSGGGYAATSTQDSSSSTTTTPAGSTTRKLLKGSSGGGTGGSSGFSGPSYRSRYGGYSYWGYGTPIYRRYGRTSRGPAVASLTIVALYSRAPVTQGAARPTANALSYTTSASACTAADKGCEVTLSAPLVKDSFDKASWTTPDVISQTAKYKLSATVTMKYPLVNVSCTTSTIPLAEVTDKYTGVNRTCTGTNQRATITYATYPQFYVVFATDDDSSEALIGYSVIPIACVILVCGTGVALSMSWKCCPSCSKKRRSGYSSAELGSYRPGAPMAVSNPMTQGDDVERTSMITYPFVTITDTSRMLVVRDGDYTSMNVRPGAWLLIDLTSNDVSTLNGLTSHVGLQGLILNDNNLSSLVGLAGHPTLTALQADGNNLRSLAGLAATPALVYVSVKNNDISTLANGGPPAMSVRYLSVANNDLRNLAGIHAFPSLTHLDCINNSISSVAGLAEACPQLVGIDLSHNDLANPTEILPLANLPGLAVLDIRGNDFPAMAKDQIRTHFAATRPGCQLLS